MTLEDWQFTLGDLSFGAGQSVTLRSWDLGDTEVRDQDQPSAFGDFRVFGRDRYTPGQWAFGLLVEEPDTASAMTLLEELRAAWSPSVRLTPGATTFMQYDVGGRTRRVFGRPRRFTAVTENLVFGVVPVAADFTLAHLGSFDDDEQASPTISLGASELGGSGVTFPVSFPFLWGGTVASPRHATIVVGGARDTHLTATITGGSETVTDPYVIVSGRTLQFDGTIVPGETVLVVGTPWDAQVVRPDGTTPAVTLAAGSRLSDLTVAPGQHEVSFGGIDGSGTATCVLSWRNAYHSI